MSPKKAKSLTQLLATFDVETLGEGDRNAGLICWHSLPGGWADSHLVGRIASKPLTLKVRPSFVANGCNRSDTNDLSTKAYGFCRDKWLGICK